MGTGKRIRKIVVKTLKYTGISIVAILALMFLLPYLFPSYVSDKIKQWANQSIEAELNFSKARLSFFNHFPSLTLTLYDVSLKGSAPFRQDTLVAGKEIALGVNLASIFGKTLHIDEIYLTKSKLHILVDEQGRPNYNIYAPKQTAAKEKTTDTSSTALKLERIQIDECELVYDDRSIPIKINAGKLDYLGKGDLSKAIFDLASRIKMEGFSLSYGGRSYLENKSLDAKLVTQINTSSLALIFQENNLKINQLPVQFKGSFDFLKDGYRMDFSLVSPATEFKNLFTALPPAAVTWLDKTTVKGEVAMAAELKGDYIASKNMAPDLSFSMNVKNGSVAAKSMTEPVQDILINFHFAMPQLNMEQMAVKIDTLHAKMGADEISAAIEEKGMSKPFVNGNINAHLDLGKWYQTLSLDSTMLIKGLFAVKGNFNGTYDMKAKQFPVSNVSMELKNGYIKTGYYPVPVTDLHVSADVFNTKGTTGDLRVNIKPVTLKFDGQDFTLTSKLENFDNLSYNIRSKGVLDLGKLYRLFAVDGYDLKGKIITDLSLEGTQADAMAKRYNKLHNKGTLVLQEIRLRSNSFPKPFLVRSGAFHIKDDKLVADKLLMRYGNTNVTLNGYVNNIINYALQDGAVLQGKWNMYTPYLYVDELMAFASADSVAPVQKKTPPASGVVMIPANLDMQFNVNAGRISYNGLRLDNCESVTTVQNGKLTISKAAFRLIDVPVNMTASYASINEKRAAFDYHIKADEFDIQKAYKEIKLFREMATAAGKASGTVALDYQLSGMLNDNMYPIFSSLKGGGVLSLKKIKVYGLKLFSAISNTTGRDKINNPDLSKVDIKTKIARNIITIERFKLRVAGFRPRFEGQVSFDGRLNLQARLGLPPFGIFGIPLSVTGTQEKPVVKIRRGRASDQLKETDEDADDDDKKEAADAALLEEQKKAAEKPKQQ